MQDNQFHTQSFARLYEDALSPCYAAPEELAASSLSLLALQRADLFKLGCVIYELFMERALFTHTSLRAYRAAARAPLPELNRLPEPIRVGDVWNSENSRSCSS